MNVLHRIVIKPRRAYAGAGLTMMLGVAVLPFLGQTLLPSFKERDFLMHWVTKPGTGHEEMVRITTLVNRES